MTWDVARRLGGVGRALARQLGGRLVLQGTVIAARHLTRVRNWLSTSGRWPTGYSPLARVDRHPWHRWWLLPGA